MSSVDTGAPMEKIRAAGLLRTQGLIGGKWVDAYDGKTLEVTTSYCSISVQCFCDVCGLARPLVSRGVTESGAVDAGWCSERPRLRVICRYGMDGSWNFWCQSCQFVMLDCDFARVFISRAFLGCQQTVCPQGQFSEQVVGRQSETLWWSVLNRIMCFVFVTTCFGHWGGFMQQGWRVCLGEHINHIVATRIDNPKFPVTHVEMGEFQCIDAQTSLYYFFLLPDNDWSHGG